MDDTDATVNGVIRWTTSKMVVFLVVQAGVVVDAQPRYAGKHAVNKNARTLWRHLVNDGLKPGADLIWLPNVTPFLSHRRHDTNPVRAWKYAGDHIAFDGHLTLGRFDAGGWYVHDTRDRVAWSHPTEASAQADVERRLATDPQRWTEIPAVSDGGSGHP